jgi:hypothetical protein
MAQLKQVCTVTNGSQTVTVIGSNVAYRILANSIFMVQGEFVPYVVATDAVFDGVNTVVTLAAQYKGETGAMSNGVFATDFTVPDNLPLISQGDVGTAAIWTAAMYKIQAMITEINPAGFAASIADIHASLNGANVAMQAAAASQTAAAGSEARAAESAKASAKSAGESAATADAARASELAAAASVEASAKSAMESAESSSSAGDAALAAHASEGKAADSAEASAESASISDGRASDAVVSADAAAASAAQINAALRSLNAVWLGEKPEDPTVDNNGDPLVNGARYFNTTLVPRRTRVYNDGAWEDENLDAEQATANAQLSASRAAASESAAASSKAAAKTSETNSKTSESNAAASAALAGQSSAAAKLSETTAAESAATATGAAINALTAVNGLLELDVGSADAVLTGAQAANSIFKFTGELKENRTVTMPATSHPFIAENLTTGKGTLTILCNGRAPAVQVVQGKASALFNDATGIYQTSSTTGVQFAKQFLIARDATLDLSHMGSIVYITAAEVTITLPLASSYPAGAGICFVNLTGGAATIANQGDDTADAGLPLKLDPKDSYFLAADNADAWHTGWYSNAVSPSFASSVSAPKILAGGVSDNGQDAIQAAGTVGLQGEMGWMRLAGPGAKSAPASLTSLANGVLVAASGMSPISFAINDAEVARFSADGRLLIGTTNDDGEAALQVKGIVRSIKGGFKFPDGTVQTTANGTTAPVSKVVTPTAGATVIPTSGYSAPFVEVFKNNGRLIPDVDFTAKDGLNINLVVAATGRDRYEYLTRVIYSPSVVFQPTSETFSLAVGATTIATPYNVGCFWVFKNNQKLIPRRDYNGTDGANIGLVNPSDNATDVYEVVTFTPFTVNGMARSGANSDITSLSGLTTAVSVAQGGTGGTTAKAARDNLGVGIVLLGSGSEAAAASVVFQDMMTPDYEDYRLVIRNLYTGSTSSLFLQVSFDNGVTWYSAANHYYIQRTTKVSSAAQTIASTLAGTAFAIGGTLQAADDAARVSDCVVDLLGANKTPGVRHYQARMNRYLNGDFWFEEFSGMLTGQPAVTAVRLYATTGATISCDWALYGFKK